MKSKVTLIGYQQVDKRLDRLIKTAAMSNTQALHELGQRSVGILKLNTPVESGRLRNSMGYTTSGKVVSSADEVSDRLDPNSEKDSVEVGTNVIYAASVEYMATNGSQGYFYRSSKQIKAMATAVIRKFLQKGMKL